MQIQSATLLFSFIFAFEDTQEGRKGGRALLMSLPHHRSLFWHCTAFTKGQSNGYPCGSQTSNQLLTTGWGCQIGADSFNNSISASSYKVAKGGEDGRGLSLSKATPRSHLYPFFPIKWVILHTDVYHAYLTKLHHGQDLKTKARATPTQFIQQEIWSS